MNILYGVIFSLVLKAPRVELAGDCGRIRDLANVSTSPLSLTLSLSLSLSLSLIKSSFNTQKVLDMLYEDPPSERTCPYGIPKNNKIDYNTTSVFSGGSGSSRTSNLLGKLYNMCHLIVYF